MKNELTTEVCRTLLYNETIFHKIEIKDPSGKIWFKGKLYTEQNQSEPKIKNLDQKIMEAIRNIPNHF
jgi:hypothetical protein